ncbi:ribonuclease domain-containing protein [Streptomyces sp. NPDC048696]|uniref:ribonuclease domain-containing protein n=1 Tax=Streptomyces sp. NPDC048696 TaxID=3365585 RepID=UPI0037121834
MLTRYVRTTVPVLLACLALLLTGCGGKSKHDTKPQTTPTGVTASGAAATPGWVKGMATVRAAQLPPEAQQTLKLIDKGGPFPYAKDGTVFGNFEKALPQQKRGYYHEYTVITPQSRDRGTRRLISGQSGEIYYTGDHYKTFKAVLR